MKDDIDKKIQRAMKLYCVLEEYVLYAQTCSYILEGKSEAQLVRELRKTIVILQQEATRMIEAKYWVTA